MAEPVPDSVQKEDGQPATTTTDGPESSLPTNAEDRAAAQALSSLNADEAQIENGDGAAGTKGAPSAADKEALGKAMNRLEMIAGVAPAGGAGGAAGKKKDAAADKAKAAAEKSAVATEEVKKKPAVKVAPEDVNLLVEQLDLTKPKATELLKTHEGDSTKAIRAFIAPTVA